MCNTAKNEIGSRFSKIHRYGVVLVNGNHSVHYYNDTYGRKRMYEALLLRKLEGVAIPSERTVYRVMKEIDIRRRPKRKPNGITKADKEARKSDDLLKRDFQTDRPLEKAVMDITEIKASDGKLYVSALFDCFNLEVLVLAMVDNMKADLCVATICNVFIRHPSLPGARVHSDYAEVFLYRKLPLELALSIAIKLFFGIVFMLLI